MTKEKINIIKKDYETDMKEEEIVYVYSNNAQMDDTIYIYTNNVQYITISNFSVPILVIINNDIIALAENIAPVDRSDDLQGVQLHAKNKNHTTEDISNSQLIKINHRIGYWWTLEDIQHVKYLKENGKE